MEARAAFPFTSELAIADAIFLKDPLEDLSGGNNISAGNERVALLAECRWVTEMLNHWKSAGLKVGQNVVCRIKVQVPGGYSVVTAKDNLPGILNTDQRFKEGEEVLAQYVATRNNRLIFSPIVSEHEISKAQR